MIKRKVSKITGVILIFCTILSITLFWNTGLTLGSNDPDVTVYVHGSGTQGGPMFSGDGEIGGGLWMPGRTEKGNMRVCNNYSKKIRVENLGLCMTLAKKQGQEYNEVTDRDLIRKFAENMKLTIRKGRLLIFSGTIYNKSFYDMLYRKGSAEFTGFNLPAIDRFDIDKNDHVDLEYTVHMDENAGNDLQGLKATVAFLVNVYENPDPYNPGDDDDDEDDKERTPDGKGHWAHDCIASLLNHGIIEPYPDGTIKPDNYITRAEAAVLMGKALKLKNLREQESPYKDELPDWARGYIVSATEAKVFKGYTDGTFRADNFILREEVAAVFIRAFNKKLLDDSELEFEDRDKIAQWAKEYIRASVQNGIVTGTPDNYFKPADNMTRAEVFTIVCKLLGYHKEHSGRGVRIE